MVFEQAAGRCVVVLKKLTKDNYLKGKFMANHFITTALINTSQALSDAMYVCTKQTSNRENKYKDTKSIQDLVQIINYSANKLKNICNLELHDEI